MNLSFIKLDINIMNDTKIKIIRKMPSGDTLIVLWVGLLCLGMQSGRAGVLEIGDGIPFDPETLSAELDIELSVVNLGISVFKKLKMIEFFEDKSIYITNFEKHQELDKIELAKEKVRLRVIKHREKKKQLSLPCNGYKDVTVTQSNATDIEQETEKEQDIELDIDKSNINTDLFEYWNSKGIIKHKTIKPHLSKIKSTIKNYSLEDIKNSIDNYDRILKDKIYYWSHSWTISEFLTRGIEKFIDFNICHKNYIANKNNSTTKKIDNMKETHNAVTEAIKNGTI